MWFRGCRLRLYIARSFVPGYRPTARNRLRVNSVRNRCTLFALILFGSPLSHAELLVGETDLSDLTVFSPPTVFRVAGTTYRVSIDQQSHPVDPDRPLLLTLKRGSDQASLDLPSAVPESIELWKPQGSKDLYIVVVMIHGAHVSNTHILKILTQLRELTLERADTFRSLQPPLIEEVKIKGSAQQLKVTVVEENKKRNREMIRYRYFPDGP